MDIKQFLRETNLENTLLVGYYGGGNFGDELLLEVMLIQLRAKGVKRLAFMYMVPGAYWQFHHEHGYRLVAGRRAIIASALRAKNIVVGGGGLWGLDVNMSVFALSLLLFGLRLVGKRVHLIGVGYYGSASRLGRVSAWLAGKSATTIIARDPETQANFQPVNHSVVLGRDIAWQVPEIDLTPYAAEADALDRTITPYPQMVYITLRANTSDRYRGLVEQIIQDNPKVQFVVGLLWPGGPASDLEFLRSLVRRHKHVQFLDGHRNPLALTLFFKRHAKQFRFITPQYHAILIAGLYGIPAAPIVYDNKVKQLFAQQGVDGTIPLGHLAVTDLQRFIGSTDGPR